MTRQICSKINADVLERKENRPYIVSKYSYEKQTPEYQNKMETIIEQILSVLEDYYPSEYELLKILALDGSDMFKKKMPLGDSSITHLLGYCLVTRERNDYFIRIRSIELYLNKKHKYEKLLDDSSEKLARITERRGKIEKQLRRIIQTQLLLKYGKKAKDQMIKVASGATKDKSQETKLRSADFKAAMQELYFWQLKTLILDDWKSYQMLFPDKKKFETFFDIINSYRADAHAKEIDEEDEALLNYAFKYFEKVLEESY